MQVISKYDIVYAYLVCYVEAKFIKFYYCFKYFVR